MNPNVDPELYIIMTINTYNLNTLYQYVGIIDGEVNYRSVELYRK